MAIMASKRFVKVLETRPVFAGEFPDVVFAPGANIGDIVYCRTHGHEFMCQIVQITGHGEGGCEVKARPMNKRLRAKQKKMVERETAAIVKSAELSERRLARQGYHFGDGIVDALANRTD